MLKNVKQIDQKILAKLYDFTIQNDNNIIIFGGPGIGKSQMAQQAIKRTDYKYIYINLSVLEAPDFIGIPSIVDGFSTWAPPEFLPLYETNSEPAILLVDEIDKAKQELQNPLLELLQFRSINGRKVNVKAVIATGNRPEDLSFSRPVSHALANRCSIYTVNHNFSVWQKWARENYINSLVVGFLHSNQDYLFRPQTDECEYCFPSPRSWTYAANDLDKAADESSDFKYCLVAGRVGEEAALKFKIWLDHYREIESDIYLLASEGMPPEKSISMDRLYVYAVSVVQLLTNMCNSDAHTLQERVDKTNNIKRYTKNICSWLMDIPSEYAIAALKSSLNMSTVRINGLMEIPEFIGLFEQIEKSMDGY